MLRITLRAQQQQQQRRRQQQQKKKNKTENYEWIGLVYYIIL